ncbi:hypothetical protein MMC30_003173 [Trapelia coarctata]|nr:hypothetical protein [Trapelia coarctata]
MSGQRGYMTPDRPSLRGLPRKVSQPNLSASSDLRLSVIAEDGDVQLPPRAVTKTHNRPFSRRWNLGNPPRHSYEKSPPEYSLRDESPPKKQRFMAIRNNKQLAKRGGWKRLLCIILFLIAVIVALAVGLSVGLKKHNSTGSTAPPKRLQEPSSTPTGPFPIGTYALNTFLDAVSTGCTSNAATWRCYPYTTYAGSPSGALAVFSWVISGSPGHYLISSTNNPFAINFVNASLNLVDANTPTERYTFTIPINKVVVPSTSITADNTMAACQFNNAQFQANLYTRMANTYPSNSSSPSSDPISGVEPWPYAVEVIQSIGGGANVPACYKVHDGNFGARVTGGLVPQPSGQNCNCTYKNFDP